MASENNLSVVIDIGTSKIVALAGEKNEQGKMVVLGAEKTFSKGIKRGIVYNIDQAANAIHQVLTKLEERLEIKISKVCVAYAGQHMKTINYQNSKFTSEEGIVTKFDVDHLYHEAKKVEPEEELIITQVIPTSFVIDKEITELNPVGITGREIVANYKLLVVPEIYVQNLQRVFNKLGVELEEITLSILAVTEAVITAEEKEMGAIVLDVGSGTSKMAIYYDNKLIHTAVIPFGGNVVTRDIKEGCSILLKWAEQLKIKFGQALGDFADDQKYVTIPVHSNLEPKEISFKSLAYIIQARLEEIMDSVHVEIQKSGVIDKIGAGIVLTGGTSNLNNFISLVKFRTGMDARIANLAFNPICDKELAHDYHNFTALGMLNLQVNKAKIPVKETRKRKKQKKASNGLTFLDRVKQGAFAFFDDDNEDIPLN